MTGFILGSVGAAVCAHLFFMFTAFGGGGLVAPGRPPLAKGVERYLNASLVAGPLFCAFFGVLPWLTGRAFWFAIPPGLIVIQAAILFALFRGR